MIQCSTSLVSLYRQGFHWFKFLMIFFNVVVGLTSALLRNIFSLVFGLLLMPRLDRTVLMKGFARFDSGEQQLSQAFCVSSFLNRVQNLHWIPVLESIPQ